jgi:hypothetical protein
MLLTDTQIEFFAEETGIPASQLKTKLAELDKQFKECALQRDWMGCLTSIRKQNRLLGLCPIENESDENKEDCHDGVVLLTAIRIVSPMLYSLIIHKLKAGTPAI